MLHDIKAEQILLSTALTNKKALMEISQLDKEDFCDNNNKIVFEALKSLNDKNENIDSLVLRQKLIKDNNYKKLGGDIFLANLIKEWTAPNYLQILKDVKELSNKRKINKSISEAKEKINNLTVEEIEEKIKNDMREIQTKNIDKLKEISEYTDNGLEEFLKDNNYIKTGLHALDWKINGLYDTELIVIGARPSIGKSALALHFAKHISEQKKKVLFFSLEMPNEETILRILADHANYPLNLIRKNNFELKDKQILEYKLKKISKKMPYLYLIDNAYDLNSIVNISRKHTELKEIDVIIIDYLQLIENTNSKRLDRRLQIEEITRRLKLLANELKLPIVLLSQLSRSVETRTSKVPLLSDLRESGSIEQDANVVLFLHKEDEYLNKRDIIIAKDRNGEKGRIAVNFEEQYLRFH